MAQLTTIWIHTNFWRTRAAVVHYGQLGCGDSTLLPDKVENIVEAREGG